MWNAINLIPDPENDAVIKYVFETDNAVAEAVLYRYPDYATRTVICFSTQSGCPVGCRFCGAGDAFVRNLTPEEIVSQIDRILDDIREKTGVTVDQMGRCQLMGMSMGEPLLNMKHLSKALRILKDKYPSAALLISTSAPNVDYEAFADLSCEIDTIGLQFSIHESTDEARNLLIPFKAKLNLEQIAAQGEYWSARTGRKPYFNYCAHHLNTSEEDAERLLKLFDPTIFCATVSVICERNEGHASSNDVQRQLAVEFGNKLLVRGYDVRVFDPSGQDTVGGGCGQLHFVQKWFSEHSDKTRSTAGTGLPQVGVPR